jgi:hypothetical protein
MMEPVRAPFYVGLGGFVAGLVLLALWYFMPQPAMLALRFLHGLFFGLGMLLLVTGGFLALCIGMVYLVYFIVQPRTAAKAAK